MVIGLNTALTPCYFLSGLVYKMVPESFQSNFNAGGRLCDLQPSIYAMPCTYYIFL